MPVVRDVALDGPPPLVGPSSLEWVLTPPRSISLLYAALLDAGRETEAADVLAVQADAVEAAVRVLDREAAYGMLTTDGATQWLDSTGVLASVYLHLLGAASAPEAVRPISVHTHLLIDAVVESADDGHLLDLDATAVRRELPAAYAVYDRCLRSWLPERLPVSLEEGPDGLWEIAGTPAASATRAHSGTCRAWPVAQLLTMAPPARFAAPTAAHCV